MLISGVKISPLLDCIKIVIPGEDISCLSNLLETLGEKEINIWFAVQVKNSEDLMNVTLCINPREIEKGITVIRGICPDLEVSTLSSLNIISAFPYRNNPEIAFLFLKALDSKNIPVLAVSTSLSSISCLIHHEQCTMAKETLKKAFSLT